MSRPSLDEVIESDLTKGRIDIADLGIQWKWAGVGVSPEPVTKPQVVEIDGRPVELYWPEKGWGRSRLFMLCPICGGRSRSLYELPLGRLGCHEHVSAERRREEEALFKLRRAQRMKTNNRWRPRAEQLEREALDALLDFGPFLGKLLREEARLNRITGRQGSRDSGGR